MTIPKFNMAAIRPAQITVQLDWVAKAAVLPGKSLHVGVCLLWLVSMRKTNEVQLGRATMSRFKVSRDAVFDGLRRLESAKLVRINRQPGVKSVVTVLGENGVPLLVM